MDAIVKKAEVFDIDVLNEISIEAKSFWNYPTDWMDAWKNDLILSKNDFSSHEIFNLTSMRKFIE